MTARRGAPAKRHKKHVNHERWVISYADLLTLLLAFFVVLYASSTRDKQKIAAEAASFMKAFHGAAQSITTTPAASTGIMMHQPSPIPRPVSHPVNRQPPAPPIHAPSPPDAATKAKAADIVALQILSTALEGLLHPLIAKKQVSVVAQPLTVTISLNASVLFPTGQAVLTKPAAALLSTVATSLKAMPSRFSLVVQGFTDNQPIATVPYPSNWSLSAERAVSVVELFTNDGLDGGQLSAQGYGEFAPIASNATDAGRTTNRRVVIVIKAPDASSIN